MNNKDHPVEQLTTVTHAAANLQSFVLILFFFQLWRFCQVWRFEQRVYEKPVGHNGPLLLTAATWLISYKIL